MDNEEEAIDVSASPFAPASDYLGKRLLIIIMIIMMMSEAYLH